MDTKTNKEPPKRKPTTSKTDSQTSSMNTKGNNTAASQVSQTNDKQVYLQQKQSHPRKLSGPNNKVPTNLLSNWKDKYKVQEQMFEEEEEEEQQS